MDRDSNPYINGVSWPITQDGCACALAQLSGCADDTVTFTSIVSSLSEYNLLFGQPHLYIIILILLSISYRYENLTSMQWNIQESPNKTDWSILWWYQTLGDIQHDAMQQAVFFWAQGESERGQTTTMSSLHGSSRAFNFVSNDKRGKKLEF